MNIVDAVPHFSTDPDHVSSSRRRQVDFIQAARGIAALLVVFVHVRQRLDISPQQNWGEWLFSSAYCGVDLFFLISGFIMVYTTANVRGGVASLKRFYIHRAVKIWPAYVIMTLIFVLSARHGLKFFHDPQQVKDLAKSLLFYPRARSDAPFFGYASLIVGWTLNYEIYFYLLFGLSLLFGRFRWIAFFTSVVSTLVMIPLFKTGHFAFDAYTDYAFHHPYLNIVTSPMIWDFVSGVLIGLLYISKLRISNQYLLKLLLYTSLSVFLWHYFSGVDHGHGMTRYGAFLTPVLLFLALADQERPLHVPQPLIWLGNISFSLYLVHPIVVDGVPKLFTAWGLHDDAFAPSSVLIIVPFALLFATLSHRYIEVKLSGAIRKRIIQRLDGRALRNSTKNLQQIR